MYKQKILNLILERTMRQSRLYIIPRTDMDTMTPGRAIAQATHAATKMIFDIQNISEDDPDYTEFTQMLEDYLDEANGFGTTIVLKPKSIFDQEDEFASLIHRLKEESGDFVYPAIANVVNDPEYFIKDGSVTHIVPNVTTCLYMFGDPDDLKQLLGSYELY